MVPTCMWHHFSYPIAIAACFLRTLLLPPYTNCFHAPYLHVPMHISIGYITLTWHANRFIPSSSLMESLQLRAQLRASYTCFQLHCTAWVCSSYRQLHYYHLQLLSCFLPTSHMCMHTIYRLHHTLTVLYLARCTVDYSYLPPRRTLHYTL